MTDQTQNLVEIRALEPFIGSYKTTPELADDITLEHFEDAAGELKTRKVPRKSFSGMIAVERELSPRERDAHKAGTLPANVEVHEQPKRQPGASFTQAPMYATIHPVPATCFVPEAMAADLIERGLAERVT